MAIRGVKESLSPKNRCANPGSCPLESLQLFLNNVSQAEWRGFRQSTDVHVYRPGNILFYQGNRPLGLYFICSGRIKLVKENRAGRSQIVRIVRAPDLLGDRAFFAGKNYACTGEVMEESRICFLETRHFWEVFGRNTEMLRLLVQRFAHELGCAEEYMSCIAACTVVARMASHLLTAWKRSGGSRTSKNEFVLAESRTEVAQLLGTTPEAVSRALAEVCSKGLIAVQGRRVRILSEDRLRLVACLPDSEDY